MSVSYSTNFMGPLDDKWFAERNTDEPWYSGRIDIEGLDEEEYYSGMSEYPLPPMDEDSWSRFTDWLNDYVTPTLVSYETIIEDFEEDTGFEIRWASDTFGEEE